MIAKKINYLLIFTVFISCNHNSANSHYKTAMKDLSKCDLTHALQEINISCDKEKDNPLYLLKRAEIKIMLNKFYPCEILSDLNKLIKIDSFNAESFLVRGYMYNQIAILNIDCESDRNSNSSVRAFEKINIDHQIFLTKKSLDDFKKAISLRKDWYLIYEYRAETDRNYQGLLLTKFSNKLLCIDPIKDIDTALSYISNKDSNEIASLYFYKAQFLINSDTVKARKELNKALMMIPQKLNYYSFDPLNLECNQRLINHDSLKKDYYTILKINKETR